MDAVTLAMIKALGGGGSSLPAVTSADNGKVLTVQDGAWVAGKSVYIIYTTNNVADIGAAEIMALESSGFIPVLKYQNFYYVYLNTAGRSYFIRTYYANGNCFYRYATVATNKIVTTGPAAELYSKPSTGIPETDLAQAVKDKLDKFVVTLTPTALDYSGTMDKTVAEINAAYEAGQEIVFHVVTGATTYVEVPVSFRGRNTSYDYPNFGAEIIQSAANMMIVAATGDTSDGTKATYSTAVYPLSGAMIETTYSDLKALRDAGELVPGTWYRIADYNTVINGKYDLSAVGASGYLHYAVSAGHQFDIVVLAVGESELSEVARAAHHDGDTYFSNAAVDAWEVKYCLDNDTSRFIWADATNGKGVIFGLKDEFNNECGYDFKNIMFPRYALKLADATETYTPVDTGLVYDASTQPNRYGSLMQIFTALQSYMEGGTYVNPWVQNMGGNDVNNYDFACGANILGVIQFAEIDATYKAAFDCDLYYTFDCWNGEAHTDYSLNGVKVLCLENKIAETPEPLMAILGGAAIPNGVNGTVFENVLEDTDVFCQGNVIKASAVENTFGSASNGNEIGTNSYGNTFGNYCNYNTFGSNCDSNTFGTSCYYNTFGNDCYSNTFGNNCSSNTFGNYCNYNTFGNNCSSNTLGNSCNYNTFSVNDNRNTFRSNCDSNTFGNDCNHNTFGNYCNNNAFGNDCGYNTFGNDCDSNTLQGYIACATVGDHVQYIEVSGGAVGASVWYYHVCDGVQGQSPISKLSIVGTPSRTCETWVGYDSTATLKTWCPADLAQ